MEISVTCVGSIARDLGVSDTVIAVDAGSTVSELISSISPHKRLRCMTTINGRKRPVGHELCDGDHVKLIPIVGAG